MREFSEDRPEFVGFNDFYYEKIFPFLNSREFERKRRVKKAIAASFVVGLVAIVGAIFAFMRTQAPGLSTMIGFGGVALAGVAGSALLKKLKGETKEFLMSNVCGFIGWNYSVEVIPPPNLEVWLSNGMLPKYDRVKFEDQMSGNAHGADFRFCETHLEKESKNSKGSSNWRTVFRGVILEVDFHREFMGRTVVLRDSGIFNRKKKNGMKRVGLVDPKFEKIFEAYGTDQVEARYLLTPDFMQRLVDMETKFQGKKSRFGFLGGKLYIGIEAPNQFEAGSMFKPMVDTERTSKILGEIGAIFDVVDAVLKPLKARKPGVI
jgi:hypothetical protein